MVPHDPLLLYILSIVIELIVQMHFARQMRRFQGHSVLGNEDRLVDLWDFRVHDSVELLGVGVLLLELETEIEGASLIQF